jgi:hypothetical protein
MKFDEGCNKILIFNCALIIRFIRRRRRNNDGCGRSYVNGRRHLPSSSSPRRVKEQKSTDVSVTAADTMMMMMMMVMVIMLTAAGGGAYVYTTWYNGVSYLTGPTLNIPLNRSYCLTFYYFVAVGGRLDDSASLQVSVIGDGAGTRPDWSRRWWSSAGTGQWRQAEMSFELRSPLQVVFAVNLGGANGSSMALDDISLASGDCSGGKCTNERVGGRRRITRCQSCSQST